MFRKGLQHLLPGCLLVLFFLGSWSTTSVASSYMLLYSFTGKADGAIAAGGVVEDAAGNLYGETESAGGSVCTSKVGSPNLGCGTVYRLSPTGQLSVLVHFTGPNGAYGESPLTLIGDTLYGSTLAGGASDNGVLFSVRTDGAKFTLLHQFTGSDGLTPSGTLVLGKSGKLYGVARTGGPTGRGVLFSLDKLGVYTILHSFTGKNDGDYPSTLLASEAGALVGATLAGADTEGLCHPDGCGTVFNYVPKSGVFGVAHTFVGTDGASPYVGSISSNGTVYGNSGFLFSVEKAAGFSILNATAQNFGYDDESGPTLVPDGSLIGTEYEGPTSTGGTLYQLYNGV